MTPVRPASAIALWSLGAIGVAAIALAGDRTLFRAEPATPARVASIGLTALLVIGWPIWSGGVLTRAFVVGQGTIVLMIASTRVNEAGVTVGEWIVVSAIAFGVASLARRVCVCPAIAWTLIVTTTGGAGALFSIRGGM